MIEDKVLKFKKELNDFCIQNKNNNLVYFDDRVISNVSFSETYRSLINYNFSNKPLRDLLISYLEQIYKFSPVAISFIPYFLNKKLDIPSEEDILSFVEKPTTENIEDILDFCFKNSSLLKENDFKRIFKENGFISFFEVEKSSSLHNACVFDSGHVISSSVPKIFFDSIKKNSKDVFNANVILYDGYVENVSEINSVLTDSYEEKNNYLLICRGSHPDVERTCAVNLGLQKACLILAYPEDSFWHDSALSKMSSMLETEVLGYRTGRLLNTMDEKISKKIDFSFDSLGINLKSKDFEINKNAITKIFINESNWNKKGLIEDQLNYFRSLLQQISLCGVVSQGSLLSMGINVESIFLKEQEYFPAFPLFRALKESQDILEKISSVGFIIDR